MGRARRHSTSVVRTTTADIERTTRDRRRRLPFEAQSTWSRSARLRPADPGNWNRYAYPRGDPVNRVDRSALYDNGLY